jgi:hypothetical protein
MLVTRRRAGLARTMVAVLCAALAVLLLTKGSAHALACGGTRGVAAVPVCSPSLGFWKSGLKRTVVPTTLVNVSFCVYPFASPACAPLSRIEVTMQVRDLATGTLVGTGTLTLTPPFVQNRTTSCSSVLVPVNNPVTGGAIPPGLYTVRGSATMILTDGTRITKGGDTCFAVIEESIPDPNLPRLEIENITPDADQIAHPGDEQRNEYLFRNNDPDHAVTIDMTASNRQNSRQPTLDQAGPNGTAPISFAEPVQGDNFPLAFGDDPAGLACIALPPNPGDPAIPQVSQTVTLQPGEERAINVVSRSWALCQSGSGCEQVVEGLALWDDGTSADWCVAGVSIASTEAPPAYDCPDAGQVAQLNPVAPTVLRLAGSPVQDGLVELDLLTDAPSVNLNGIPRTAALEIDQVDPEWSRLIITTQLDDSDGPQQFDLSFPITLAPVAPSVQPGPPLIFPMPDVPFGFQNAYPTVKLMVPFEPVHTSFPPFAAQLMVQAHADSGQPQGAANQIVQPLQMFIEPLGPGALLVTIVSEPFIPSLSSFDLRIAVDLRAHLGANGPQPCNPADLAPPFGDLTFADISAFLAAFTAQDPAADLAPPQGQFTFADISAFLAAFSAGCP